MSRRARRTVRSSRSGRRMKNKPAGRLMSTSAIAVCSALAVGGVGYAVVSGADTVRPDETGCYQVAGPQDSTTLWWDVSTGWSPSQERDIQTVPERAFGSLAFNERFSLITTEADRVGDIGSARVELCGPARSSADYARHGLEKSASPTFLANEADKLYREKVEPVVADILSRTKASGRILAVDSPLLEQIQAISRRPELRDATGRKRLVLVTDGIQNTEIAHFCKVKGDLPPFRAFKTKPEFRRVAPAPMSGAEVTIYLILHASYGPYCTEDELADFWTAYFEDAGASRVDVYRLRPSGRE